MFTVDDDIRPNSTIARQHIQIKALVDTLGRRFDAGKKATRNLVSLLNSLAAHLELHFELEEEDEYLGYVLNRAPRLSGHVAQLLRQHGAMKQKVGELVDMAREAFAEDADTTELAVRFQRLRIQLLEHEQAEIDLMQEAYTRDLGSGD